tara:strand:- start:3955 stop:4269 length:315 start_codon:yes stop_codon:yes gene_type:complete
MKKKFEKKIFENDLINIITVYIKEEVDEEFTDSINLETRLFGGDGLIDSMELVVLLVRIEEFIEDEFNKSIILASEKAMSRRTSPFVRIKYLLDYIEEIINDDE